MVKQVTISASLWETTAQFSHAGVACAIVQAVRSHSSSNSLTLGVAGVAVALAAVKEFYYDRNFETTDARGSDLMDFSFYALGILIGLFI